MKFYPGDKVICNGYPGRIMSLYDDEVYVVRLDAGDVIGFESELVLDGVIGDPDDPRFIGPLEENDGTLPFI